MEYKDLLTFTQDTSKKNIVYIWLNWDSNDADYIEKTQVLPASGFFNRKKLIYLLAYISLPYDFKDKNQDWNKAAFGHLITYNNDIFDIDGILDDYDLIAYNEYNEFCHSCDGLSVTYYDETGTAYNVTFDKIYEEFKKMTYKEICEKINSIKYNE